MLGRNGSRAFHKDGSCVAVAGVAPRRRSSPALCTAAALYSPALPRGCNRPTVPRFAPHRRAIRTRSRPPRWGSLYASGPRLTTALRRQARPSGKRYLSFARSRQASLCSDCRSSGFSTDGSATAKTRGRSALLRHGGPTAACHLLRRRQAAAGDHFLFGRRDSPSALLRTRHGDLVRALALETACADSRAPDGPSLRARPSVRTLQRKPGQNMKPAISKG